MLTQYIRNASLAAALLVVSACGLHAQWYSSEHWNFDAGAGVTPAVSNTGNSLNTGWHYQLGAGYNFTPHFGTMIQFQQNNLGVSNSVLTSLSVPGGNSRIYSVTLDPIWQLRPGNRLGAYVIGGVGWYRRTLDFTQPTTASA